MGRRVAFTGLLLAAIAILFMCFSSPASAADPVPGDACGTGGYITNSFMWAGAPENGGVTNGMFCNGSTWAGVINFQSTGNVSIGATNSNGFKLYVSGGGVGTTGGFTTGNNANQVYASTSATLTWPYSGANAGSTVLIQNNQHSNSMGSFVNLSVYNSNTKLQTAYIGAVSNSGSTTYTPTIVFGQQTGATAYNEAMRIASSGNVGIGTTSPATKLDVNGTVRFAYGGESCSSSTVGGVYYSSATHLMYGCLTAGTWTQLATASGSPAGGSNTQVQFNSGGNVGGSSNLTWSGTVFSVTGNISYTGVLTDMSDRRAKERITPLQGELARIMRLQPISFVMKADPGNGTELGFIAQDAQPFFPDLVIARPDGMKAFNYIGLIAPLTEAVQEQQSEITQLRIALLVIVCGGGVLLWRSRMK